jgi:serine/threonine protein kinase
MGRDGAIESGHQNCFDVAYFHVLGFIHGDLKPAIILLDGAIVILIAVFDCARQATMCMTLGIGTVITQALETYKQNGSDRKSRHLFICRLPRFDLEAGGAAER